MTSLTFRIVVDRLSACLGMGIVTSKTADACVVRVVALAIRQTIRLEAHVGNLGPPLHGDFCPGPVTLAAEVGRLLCREILKARQAGRDGG